MLADYESIPDGLYWYIDNCPLTIQPAFTINTHINAHAISENDNGDLLKKLSDRTGRGWGHLHAF